MKRGGAHTVRGQKAPTSRPTAEQVFVYGTIPRSFRGGGSGGSRAYNNYNNHNQNFVVSPNQNQLPYTPTGPHAGRLGPGQMTMTHGSSNNVSTFRSEFVPTPMVVDGGLVLNRFSRPGGSGGGGGVESPYGYGRCGITNNIGGVVEAKNSPMNLEFYRNPHQHQELSPVSPEGGDYWSPTGSFDMSYNSSTPPALPEHPPTPRRPPPENKPSLLLNKEENQTIFDILGKGRQTLATAVIRLLVPTFSQQGWQPKETGVACLVRDTTKKSYFIQVFSLRSKSMVFRQEIYNQFEYQFHPHYQNFITFEGDSSSVGIQFADITEATQFREALDSKLEAKKQRRNEREHRRSRVLTDSNHHYPNQNQNAGHQYPQQSYTQPPPTPPVPQYTHQPPISHNNSSSSSMSNGISSQQTVSTTTTYNFPTSLKSKKMKEKDKKKIVLRKEDIGKPMDFRHIQHVGWDPNKGFDLNGVDNNLRTFFEKAGVSANQLQDENTRNFIYNFIEQNGGIETIKKLPERPAAPLPPSSHSMGHAPPVPNRQASKPAAPPPPPSRPIPPVPGSYNSSGGGPPPPPPPTRTMNIGERPQMNYQSTGYNQNNGPARPPPPAISSQSSPKPAHSNGPVPPPPPPPPPMPGAGAPPPPPPPPMSSGPSDLTDNGRTNAQQPKSAPPVADDRSQLLAAIQKGVQLKKVDPDDAQAQPKRGGGGLADCLGQIQKGIELKRVPQTTKEAPNADTMDGLAGALARALADRSKAIRPDSSSSEDDEEEGADDDEWD